MGVFRKLVDKKGVAHDVGLTDAQLALIESVKADVEDIKDGSIVVEQANFVTDGNVSHASLDGDMQVRITPVDSLASSEVQRPLSANMGRELGGAVSGLRHDVDTLNDDETVPGSVRQTVNEAVGNLVSIDGTTVQRLQEVAQWMEGDSTGSAELVAQVQRNTQALAEQAFVVSDHLSATYDTVVAPYELLMGGLASATGEDLPLVTRAKTGLIPLDVHNTEVNVSLGELALNNAFLYKDGVFVRLVRNDEFSVKTSLQLGLRFNANEEFNQLRIAFQSAADASASLTDGNLASCSVTVTQHVSAHDEIGKLKDMVYRTEELIYSNWEMGTVTSVISTRIRISIPVIRGAGAARYRLAYSIPQELEIERFALLRDGAQVGRLYNFSAEVAEFVPDGSFDSVMIVLSRIGDAAADISSSLLACTPVAATVQIAHRGELELLGDVKGVVDEVQRARNVPFSIVGSTVSNGAISSYDGAVRTDFTMAVPGVKIVAYDGQVAHNGFVACSFWDENKNYVGCVPFTDSSGLKTIELTERNIPTGAIYFVACTLNDPFYMDKSCVTMPFDEVVNDIRMSMEDIRADVELHNSLLMGETVQIENPGFEYGAISSVDGSLFGYAGDPTYDYLKYTIIRNKALMVEKGKVDIVVTHPDVLAPRTMWGYMNTKPIKKIDYKVVNPTQITASVMADGSFNNVRVALSNPHSTIDVPVDTTQQEMAACSITATCVKTALDGNGGGSAKEFEGKKIVCFGDSMTQGSDEDGLRYSDHIMNLSGADVVNLGIGGSGYCGLFDLSAGKEQIIAGLTPENAAKTLAVPYMVNALATGDWDIQLAALDMLNNSEWRAAVERGMATDIAKVDMVTLFAGTNDLAWYTSSQVGVLGEVNPRTLYGSLSYCIEALFRANPKIKIFVFTPVVRYFLEDQKDGNGNAIAFGDFVANMDSLWDDALWSDNYVNPNGRRFIDGVDILIETARYNKVPVCDMYRGLGWNRHNYIKGFCVTDGVHAKRGYDAIGQHMYNFMRSGMTSDLPVVENAGSSGDGDSVVVDALLSPTSTNPVQNRAVTAALNEKQNVLTLTTKENGNIVIGNLAGQTKEFMPATPSGDPLHYAYEAAGAEYNDTGADKKKTITFPSFDNNNANKESMEFTHKPGRWYLNGLGDLTNEEMRHIYNAPHNGNGASAYYAKVKCRTFFFKGFGGDTTGNFAEMFSQCIDMETLFYSKTLSPSSLSMMFFECRKAKYVIPENLSCNFYVTVATKNFFGGYASSQDFALEEIRIRSLSVDISFEKCPNLSKNSVLYMINMSNAKSAITITLHPDAYAKCIEGGEWYDDVTAALSVKTFVSIISAT